MTPERIAGRCVGCGRLEGDGHGVCCQVDADHIRANIRRAIADHMKRKRLRDARKPDKTWLRYWDGVDAGRVLRGRR